MTCPPSTSRCCWAARPRTSRRWPWSWGCRSPGLHDRTAACNEYLAVGWPDGLDAEIREHDGAPGGDGGPAVRGSGGSTARPRPLRRPAVDARHDGHDPGPRAERDDRGGARRGFGRRGVRARTATTASGDLPRRRRCRVVPEDPWAQLRGAVEAVFRSWNSDRARTYREREGISDVAGHRGHGPGDGVRQPRDDSGTGVLFTRNPATGEPALYGDVMFDAQGEDVVAGTHETEPVTVWRRGCRRWPPSCASTRACSSATTGTAATSSSRSSAAGSGCSRCGSGSGRPQAALRMAVEMAEDPTSR